MSKATADLYDEHADTVRTCALQFRDFGGRRRFSGPVRTVQCLRDNQLFRSLLDEPGHGAVAVVDGGGSLETALLGDMIASKGARNGWAGCVIVGAVRDTQELACIDFGVKALGVNPAKSSKAGLGSVNQAVEVGGLMIHPGDWIYCDEDGILVSPVELA